MNREIEIANYEDALKNSTPWDKMVLHNNENIHEIFGYSNADVNSQKFVKEITSDVRLGSLVTIATILAEDNDKSKGASGFMVLWTKAASGVSMTSLYDLVKYINSALRNDEELMVFSNDIRRLVAGD